MVETDDRIRDACPIAVDGPDLFGFQSLRILPNGKLGERGGCRVSRSARDFEHGQIQIGARLAQHVRLEWFGSVRCEVDPDTLCTVDHVPGSKDANRAQVFFDDDPHTRVIGRLFSLDLHYALAERVPIDIGASRRHPD